MTSKSEYAYKRVKEKIIRGELPPLSDIVEEKLQEELEVSRTPIREAIQRLSKEGFVYVYARKGMIVAGIDINLINSVYEVRLLNEPYLMRTACKELSEEWLCRMKEALTNCPYGVDEPEYRNFYIELDHELHSVILNHCKNQFLIDMMGIVSDHSQRIRIRTSRKNEEYSRSIGEHLEIVEACLARDPERAEAAMRRHIETAKKEAFKYNII